MPVSRRALLTASVATAAYSLTGCAPSAGSSSGTPARLRAAFVGGGGAETLNYLVGPTALDYVRARLVHLPLGRLEASAPDGVAYEALAGIEATPAFDRYTAILKPGLKFSDGSPVTAADLLYSLRAPTLLKGLPFTQLVSRAFDLDAATIEGTYRVILPTKTPVADGRTLLCQSTLLIKDGTRQFTQDTPSCGPFMIKAFRAGQATVLRRNPHHGGTVDGRPVTLEEIELLSINDPQARVNALGGDQADLVTGVPPTLVGTLRQGLRVERSEPPFVSQLLFRMNPTFAPFADARIRRAVKLAVNREAIVERVYRGQAVIGNDLPARGFPGYAQDLPQREHDPAEARRLVGEAGRFAVELTAGPELTGMVETATLIVEDLKAVGIDAALRELPAGQLYADYPAYRKLPFAAGYTPPAPFEPNHLPGDDPEVDGLVAQARSAPTSTDRDVARARAQQLMWERGTTLVPVFVPMVSAMKSSVAGVQHRQFPDLATATLR